MSDFCVGDSSSIPAFFVFEKALRGLDANKASEIDLIAVELLENLRQAEFSFRK